MPFESLLNQINRPGLYFISLTRKWRDHVVFRNTLQIQRFVL